MTWKLSINDTPTNFFAKMLTKEIVFCSEQCIYSEGCDIFLASNVQTNYVCFAEPQIFVHSELM